jgi:hypothetical protein
MNNELEDLVKFLESQPWTIKPIVPRIYSGDSIVSVKTNINSVNIVCKMEESIKKRFIKNSNIKLFLSSALV